MAKKDSKRAFTGLAGSPLSSSKDVPFERPVAPSPSQETETVEQETKKLLGLVPKDPQFVNSVRRFFSMTAENVAMFLTMPEIIYKKDFVLTSTEAICINGIPFKQKIVKYPLIDGRRAPKELLVRLENIKNELNTTFSAKYSKAQGGMTGPDLTRARRLKQAERKRIEKEIRHYENDWTKVDIPGTGRGSFSVDLARASVNFEFLRTCDDGFTRHILKKYIIEAWQAVARWGDTIEIMSDFERRDKRLYFNFELRWADFENAVVQRALDVGIFCLCPSAEAAYLLFRYPTKARSLETGSHPKDDPASEHRVRPKGEGPHNSKYDERFGSQDRD